MIVGEGENALMVVVETEAKLTSCFSRDGYHREALRRSAYLPHPDPHWLYRDVEGADRI